MFGIDSAELLIIAIVALVVIGPKDLPRAMRTIGNWIARARGMARHFRSGFDTMVREADFEDMEKAWKSNNERIMQAHPAPEGSSDWGGAPPVFGEEAPAGGASPDALPADPSRPRPPPAPPRRSRAKAAAKPAPVAPPSDEPA